MPLDNFLAGTRHGEKTRSIPPEITITVGAVHVAPEAEQIRPDQTTLLTNYPKQRILL